MTEYRGSYQQSDPAGHSVGQGACRFEFDAEKITLVPMQGNALVADLGDIDVVAAADYEIRLALWTGDAIVLRQLGRAYEEVARQLLACHSDRTLQCLLLADLREVARFTGAFRLRPAGNTEIGGPCELRLYGSNLAVLPGGSQAFQWRLADVTTARFEAEPYEFLIARGDDQLRIGKLARRTSEFDRALGDALAALRADGARALHAMLPFLTAVEVQQATQAMPEGRTARMTELATINARIPAVLAANAVDVRLRPYFDELMRRTVTDALCVGYRLLRSPADSAGEESEGTGTEGEGDGEAEDSGAGEADAAGADVLYWYFFPLAAPDGAGYRNVLAWEASSASGRATYFFRIADGEDATALADPVAGRRIVAAAIGRITTALGLVNFRRRPIYLSDADLASNGEYHRYAIAARRLPELRSMRAAFLGRAIHSSFERWRDQVDAIVQA